MNLGSGGTLSLYLETCAATGVKVKIATTQSCRDDPKGGVAVQGGVTVTIGGQSFTSDANGVIEADLPPGTYPVSGSWKDYAFGFVRQNNGIQSKISEYGLPTVTLSQKVEMLEIRMLTCDPSGQGKVRAGVAEGNSIKVIRSNGPGSTPSSYAAFNKRIQRARLI